MNDAIRRAIRTFVQVFIGTVLASGVFSAFATEGVVDWSALKKVGVSAICSAFVALLTYVQNALEDSGAIPSVLKAQASSGADPVTHDPQR